MKGAQPVGSPAGAPGSSPEGVDLTLTGFPPPLSRRPGSATATKPLTRSVSAVAGSGPRRRAQDPAGPGVPPAVNNLRRSSSATQVNPPPASQAWTDPPRPVEPLDFLALFEGSPDGQKQTCSLGKVASDQGATWNILDEQPRASPPPMDPRSPPSAPEVRAGPRRRECAVTLAPSFTANNRSSKGAVGNRVTAMVHNRHSPAEKAPPPKSSNHTALSLNNILKAASHEVQESGSFQKLQKNLASSNQGARNNTRGPLGPLRRKEVTEEEAERFINRVNQAAVTIQRWYRQQAQRWTGAASGEQERKPQLPGDGNMLDVHRQKEAARRKAREEKARQARQAAMQELQQKRALRQGTLELAPRRARPRLSPAHKANNTGAEPHTAAQQDACQPPTEVSPQPQLFPEPRKQDPVSHEAAGGDREAPEASRSRAKSRAMLDELLDTLKLLEEEPEPLPPPRTYRQDRYAWSDEEDGASSLTADNLEKLGTLSAGAGPPEAGTLLSEAKLQSILSFLDEMEKSGQDRPSPAPQGPLLEDGPGRPVPEAGTSLMRLQLEVEEKKRAAALLQRALAQQRDLAERRVKETERELGRQLRQQQEHYEATIQRHLCFIDQLIEDKKVLTEKCEAVVTELRSGEQRHREQEARTQEQHRLEVKKLKEVMSATEKVRREKWINEKTRKIKEITVRGLEPEIQKLIAKHKQEVKRLKGLHEAELAQAAARAAELYGRQAEELRARLEREKEALGQQERERAQQRLEQHLEQEQRALQQRRRQLYSEVAEEKERLGQQAARQRAELEELRRQLEASSAAGGRALRAEFDKEREAQEQRHQVELKALRDQLEQERQVWEASCARKEEARLLSRERELKEEIRRGRDKDIELVIHRLEADMTQAREEGERATESRIQRIRDKYQTELAELERSERQLQERCAQLRGRLGEAEGEGVRLRGLLQQKERELADTRAVNEQLTAERRDLAQVLRQEFADRLAASEEETRQVRAELAVLRAQQQLELEQLTRDKQAELEAVHGRVKVALAKKEEAVSSLRRQHEAAVKRADHLEELLELRRRPGPNAP
ncbi:centrosomal protein of 131 kDa isoform X2 [Sorex araneus]|uniref:centrosomal protein of 131 kDa isoform X2 n=1 Tax=Sorex araneus TaxID=42254 RepID=UPI0024334B50|nr:centrosomal protein of 131 kDa isoform X2 [Sorex araneus]